MKRMSKYEIVARVVEESQAVKISIVLGNKRRMIWLDMQTANVLKMMFEKASMENRTKLERLSWDKLVNMGWEKVA